MTACLSTLDQLPDVGTVEYICRSREILQAHLASGDEPVLAVARLDQPDLLRATPVDRPGN